MAVFNQVVKDGKVQESPHEEVLSISEDESKENVIVL